MEQSADAAFRGQLVALHETLVGKVLGSYDGFELTLTGDGQGHVLSAVEVIVHDLRSIRLTFQFEIDQTYLPRIIRCIAAEFPC